MTDRTRRSRLSTGLAAAGAVLLVAGLGVAALQGLAPGAPGSPGADSATAVSTADPPPRPEPVRAARRPGAPRSVSIPALDVAAPVVPVRAPGGTLVPPADPGTLGWWADGARPGARRGSALVAGHTVSAGGGALDDLERLVQGDRIVVRTGGRLVYEVVRVDVFTKGRIARDAGLLFSQEVPGRLVLVTCEDWDGSRYLSNVVVTAREVRG